MFHLHKRILPPLGHRIIKTAAAVFICLIIYILRGYRGAVSQSAITAIICMQPYVQDSKTYAVDRIFGTILGAAIGLAYLLMMRTWPVLGENMGVAYAIMSLFVILALYSTVVIKKAGIASLVAISFLGTVIAFPNVSAPLAQTLENVVDTVIGTVVAIFVNTAHLPRHKNPDYLFFVRTMDLVPDRYRQIPSSVHIALEQLYKDGAKICLVSRWAPAFIVSQMGLLNVNAPMIIMDGAAMYDTRENKYLDVIEIPKANADRLRSILAGFHAGCNIYTVNERTLSIFRDGPINEAEKQEFETMKRSPYRHYLDGMYREDDYIAFIRVIDTKEKIQELNYQIHSVLPMGMFRTEIREETRFREYSSLYFYDVKATPEEMKRRVQQVMELECGTPLKPVNLLPRTSKYLPEHDALLLLARLKEKYEPVIRHPNASEETGLL